MFAVSLPSLVTMYTCAPYSSKSWFLTGWTFYTLEGPERALGTILWVLGLVGRVDFVCVCVCGVGDPLPYDKLQFVGCNCC